MSKRLTRVSMAAAARELAARDPDLASVLRQHGPPPLWARRPGFSTLVRIILEQQVSLASGRAAYERLNQHAGAVTPERILALGAGPIRKAGVTRQKARYVLELARAIDHGDLDLSQVGRLDDEAVRTSLTAVPGIGPWTADIYLLMALLRPDVWPAADLALRHSMRELRDLRHAPTDDELGQMALGWRPHRAVAARMLWRAYLASRGRAG